MLSHVIMRVPAKSLHQGLSSVDLGTVDYALALKQHAAYVNAVKKCQVDLTLLRAVDELPDSCFVEDVAICTEKFVIVTHPRHEIRRREVEYMLPTLRRFYNSKIEYLSKQSTLEGGDVLKINDQFFVGLTGRTNASGS